MGDGGEILFQARFLIRKLKRILLIIVFHLLGNKKISIFVYAEKQKSGFQVQDH
jgi:hypothetical protein